MRILNLKKELNQTFWLIVLRSTILIGFGVLLISNTFEALTGLIIFLGAYWLIDGFMTSAQSLKMKDQVKNWGWVFASGILGIISGFLLLSYPVFGTIVASTFFVIFFSSILILSGIMSIAAGIKLRKEIENEWAMIIGGVVWILFACLFLSNPMFSVMILAKIIGVFAIIGGAAMLAFGIKAKRHFNRKIAQVKTIKEEMDNAA